MGKIVAIGGGEMRLNETLTIRCEIKLDATNKKSKNYKG